MKNVKVDPMSGNKMKIIYLMKDEERHKDLGKSPSRGRRVLVEWGQDS